MMLHKSCPSQPPPSGVHSATTAGRNNMKPQQPPSVPALRSDVPLLSLFSLPQPVLRTCKFLLLSVLFLLLSCLPQAVHGTCRFPDFMQRDEPWAASYGPDSRLVMYVKGNHMTVSKLEDHHDQKYMRKCERRAPENKFLVAHQEDKKDVRFLCMQFLKRSENIVQMKVSEMHSRQSSELCDEQMMAIDRWPIVQMSQTPAQKIRCPFVGGYNVNMYYPNNTVLCAESTRLMRIESECEQDEGIVLNFRQPECVPASLPSAVEQRAYCIAHWTQASQTFIILQHADEHKQTWCLRISDPLSDIHSAHLLLDLVCDTADTIRDTRNYFRLTMSRRVYASTCEDEIESDVCEDMKDMCKAHKFIKQECARTCGACRSRRDMTDCAFEETYRGLWVESSAGESDRKLSIGPYSLDIERLGSYDCLRVGESKKHKDKRVLVRIDDRNGCYPRYACVEMEKKSSSVMRFRLGERIRWPLPQTRDHKDHVCAAKHFRVPNGIETHTREDQPPRLLVKDSDINRVPCRLPRRLQNGVAFREEGQSCSGCLMYQPSLSRDRFLVQPHNCSGNQRSAPLPQQRLTTIEYSCLAAFTFHNNTYAVVTKTNTYGGWGQYLCWIFTPDNHIKVMKAAETLLEDQTFLKPELLQAQFTITKEDRDKRCDNIITINTHTSTGRVTDYTTRGSTRRPTPPVTYLVKTGRPTVQPPLSQPSSSDAPVGRTVPHHLTVAMVIILAVCLQNLDR